MHDRLAPYINSHRAKAIFDAAEIDTRHSILAEADFLADEPGTKARNDVYMPAACQLGAAVITRALGQAALSPTEVDHLIVVSCTGFDTPGLDVLLAKELSMRPDVRRSALVGMGCHAGLTGLDRALLEVHARPQSRAVVLTAEFGTLHFQPGSQLDDMVAAAIFGDGLAAVVLGASNGNQQPRIVDTATHTDPASLDLLGFYLSDRGFQIKLSTKVPKLLRAVVPDLVHAFLSRSHMRLADIRFWGIHPGGAKILNYVGQALDLPAEALTCSRTVLRTYGNMSSSTIFFVLNEIIRTGQPHPGDLAVLMGFGPGLTIELALLAW